MPTLLDRLQRIACRGRRLKPFALAVALGLFLASVAVVMLVPGTSGDQVLLPLILGAVWCLSGFLFVYLFEAVPPQPDPHGGPFVRIQRRLVRGLYWIFALAFMVLGALVLMLTLRLAREWLGALVG